MEALAQIHIEAPGMRTNPQARERPYDLYAGNGRSQFLVTLARLCDTFERESELRAGRLIDRRVARSEHHEPSRARGEYAVELLTAGVLRREYGQIAAATRPDTLARLAELWRVRSSDPSRKATADAERGVLFEQLVAMAQCKLPVACAGDERLTDWLAATGEFVQESLRLQRWLRSLDSEENRQEFGGVTAALADWFIPLAAAELGIWTRGVDGFRSRVLANLSPREDLLLITRGPTLYHLNMMGAEIMNRAFRKGFARHTHRVVLVPGCMRSRDESSCQASRQGLDIKCTRCCDSCEVATLDRLGEAHGFRVLVVPHASSFTAWLERWTKEQGTALVAVACPLHLVPGGYEIRALGLEAQCVLLDFSGCKRHWDPVGTPTRLDHKRLLELCLQHGNPQRVSTGPSV